MTRDPSQREFARRYFTLQGEEFIAHDTAGITHYPLLLFIVLADNAGSLPGS
jgi:hypothetical protein